MAMWDFADTDRLFSSIGTWLVRGAKATKWAVDKAKEAEQRKKFEEELRQHAKENDIPDELLQEVMQYYDSLIAEQKAKR